MAALITANSADSRAVLMMSATSSAVGSVPVMMAAAASRRARVRSAHRSAL